MTQDWDIKPRAESCATCQAPFVDKHPYQSCLAFGEQGYARQDYCEPCWDGRPPDPDASHSAWRGIFRSPPPPEEEALKKETAESLLRKLIEEQNPARERVIFILAVMLERKKLLIERDVQLQNGATTRVYEHKHSGETFVIQDPHLNLNELGDVQQEVVELLGRGDKQDAPTDGDAANADDQADAAALAAIPEAAGDDDETPSDDAETDAAPDEDALDEADDDSDASDDSDAAEDEFDDDDDDEDDDDEEEDES